MGPGLSNSLRTYETLWNFADVTLADDDTNSILADDAQANTAAAAAQCIIVSKSAKWWQYLDDNLRSKRLYCVIITVWWKIFNPGQVILILD